jgi:hypothetical protein
MKSPNSDPQPLPSRFPMPQGEPQVWEEAYRDIARGNPDAFELIVAWVGYCHTVDDAVDQDTSPDLIGIVGRMLHWTTVVAENPLFAKHRETITAFVIATANTYIDSVRWERCGDPRKERYGNAYRSFWCELIYYIAFLVGGLVHMRAMADKYRAMAWASQNEEERPIPLLTAADLPAPAEEIVREAKIQPRLMPLPIRTPEQLDRLRTFAQTIADATGQPHTVDTSLSYVILRTNEDRWIGYGVIIALPSGLGIPVMITAWHPDHKRECVEGMRALTFWALMTYGRAATLIDEESPLMPFMGRLGYRDWNLKFFATDP